MSAGEIGEYVGDALENVLGEPIQPTSDAGSRADRLLARIGLPLLRSRRADAAPALSADDAVRLRERFIEATRLLVQAAPHRTRTYPTEELRLLIALRATEPAPADVVLYLRRYGLAVLAVLDLMEDDK
ncbi:hypothetical protein R1T08_14940 [Streptomyces sp. SBC-4]|nr:hypothetical protein [Streptomyces sp. SBC-4]MDV5145473.1 hypothetical protein [Streptomyces sp. SBC-4]